MIIGTMLIIASFLEYECGIDYDGKGTPIKIAKALNIAGDICLLGGFYFGI